MQHAAISIYLSGLFDHHRSYWQRYNIPVPTLQPEDIEIYVSTILDNTEQALRLSEVSSISYVFALRVAGARSYTQERRMMVTKLLNQIGRCYVATGALVADLEYRWSLS